MKQTKDVDQTTVQRLGRGERKERKEKKKKRGHGVSGLKKHEFGKRKSAAASGSQ